VAGRTQSVNSELNAMDRLSVLANDLSILSLTRILTHPANWSFSHWPTSRNSCGSYLPERYLSKRSSLQSSRQRRQFGKRS
jgi:uncharacterized protein YbdZ (MbtH family)